MSVARALRAYPRLIQVGLSEAVAYRAEMIVWILTWLMPLVSLALWSAVASGGPVGRFDGRAFTSYFLATLVVKQLTGSWLVWELNQEIRSGALSRRLLRPIHPLVAYRAENLAALPLRIALIRCRSSPSRALRDSSARTCLTSPVHLRAFSRSSLLGAWLINFFTMAIIGSLHIFLESSTATVFEVWLVAFAILSGLPRPARALPGLAPRRHERAPVPLRGRLPGRARDRNARARRGAP